MATTNFGFRKRQLELEKKRKKEEKLKRKQERGTAVAEDGTPQVEGEEGATQDEAQGEAASAEDGAGNGDTETAAPAK